MNSTPQAVWLVGAEQPAPARIGLASWPPHPVKARSMTTPAAATDARPRRTEVQIGTPSQSAAYRASLMTHAEPGCPKGKRPRQYRGRETLSGYSRPVPDSVLQIFNAIAG